MVKAERVLKRLNPDRSPNVVLMVLYVVMHYMFVSQSLGRDRAGSDIRPGQERSTQ